MGRSAICVLALWLAANTAQACEVLDGYEPENNALATKACELLSGSEDILTVQAATPGLFYITVSESLYRAMQMDKVSAEKMAFKMIDMLQGILKEEHVTIFYMWNGKKIGKASRAVFSREPYLELY